MRKWKCLKSETVFDLKYFKSKNEILTTGSALAILLLKEKLGR